MKSKIILSILSYAFFLILSNIFTSCSREYLGDTLDGVPNLEENTNASEFIGEKLENPYSLENMRKAYNSLSEKLIASTGEQSPFNETEIQTTDYYVRFLIEENNQLGKLESDSLNLSVLPLDYEIKEGSVEVTAENSEKPSYWIYTSVPVSYDFPKNIKYQLLEELFLPESIEEENNEIQASIKGNNKVYKSKEFYKVFLENLEDESLLITGNLDEKEVEQDLQAGWFKRIFTIRRRPSETPRGHIFVKNTTTNDWNPVIGIKVKTRRWFKWGHGWTNADGWFHVNNSYRNPIYYEFVFKNSRGFKVWSTFVTVSSARYNVGRFDSGQRDFYIHEDQRAWRFATVNNATEYYYRYCHELGIGEPTRGMRIVAHNGGWTSAPMLRHVWGYHGFNTLSQLRDFIYNTNGVSIAANILLMLTKLIQPDIIIGTQGSTDTALLYEKVFHELSHASHFEQVGSRYWVKYIDYIAYYGRSSNPYGDGSGRNNDLAALSEMWAYYMGYYLTLRHFGENNGVVKSKALENFTPVQRPDNISVYRGGKPITSLSGWIPIGLVHDLVDDNVDFIRDGYYDNVSGYTLSQIFWAMRPGVETLQELRDRLLQNNGYHQSEQVNKLFEAYYYK